MYVLFRLLLAAIKTNDASIKILQKFESGQ